MHNRTIVSVFLLVFVISIKLSAADQSSRKLKVSVELGKIAAKPVTLPSGEVVDFEYVANAQILYSLLKSGFFYERYTDFENQDFDTREESTLRAHGFSDFDISMLQAGQYETVTGVPACVYESPQLRMNGNILSFELTNSFGLRIGFNQSQSFIPNGAGVELKMSSMRLDLGLKISDYLVRQTLAYGYGDKNKRKIELKVDVGVIPIGFSIFFDQSLLSTLRKAYDEAIGNVVKNFKNVYGVSDWNNVWEAAVIKPVSDEANNDTDAVINAGLAAGLRVGDTLEVYNRNFVWNDPNHPCEKGLKRAFRSPTQPIATIVVKDVHSIYSYAEVEGNSLVNIQPGALVRLKTLAP